MPDALHDVCSGDSSDQLSTQPWSHIGDTGTVYQVSTKLKLNQVSQRKWTSRFVATIDYRKKW